MSPVPSWALVSVLDFWGNSAYNLDSEIKAAKEDKGWAKVMLYCTQTEKKLTFTFGKSREESNRPGGNDEWTVG